LKIDLFEQLERHASMRPGDVALRTISDSSTRSITFGELMDRSRALSRLIEDAGVQPGCRVGLLMPNDHEFGVAFLAAASAGAVIVPLDPSQEEAPPSRRARSGSMCPNSPFLTQAAWTTNPQVCPGRLRFAIRIPISF
jgi:acyl-CoA synthetase (AMP-forming)/AMP-acid ligase II